MTDKPRVVDVKVERKDGLVDTYHARVTLDDGTSASNWDTSEAAAVRGATEKANSRTSWEPSSVSSRPVVTHTTSETGVGSSRDNDLEWMDRAYARAPLLLSEWWGRVGALLGVAAGMLAGLTGLHGLQIKSGDDTIGAVLGLGAGGAMVGWLVGWAAMWFTLYAVGRPIVMSALAVVLVLVGASEGWKGVWIALVIGVMLLWGYAALRNWWRDM